MTRIYRQTIIILKYVLLNNTKANKRNERISRTKYEREHNECASINAFFPISDILKYSDL